MIVEKELFEKLRPDTNKLLHFGFEAHDGIYTYEKSLGIDALYAHVEVQGNTLTGKVLDRDLDEEYIAVHLPGQKGAYASSVSEKYLEILEDIAKNCFTPVPFISDQANRLAEWVETEWKETYDFPFAKSTEGAAFRNPDNRKWYGIILNVDYKKLGIDKDGKTEILNVKTEPGWTQILQKEEGILECYHMNKEKWVSILLDETVPDERIHELLKISRSFTMPLSGRLSATSWLVPANPKYFDLEEAYEEKEEILWKQSTSIHKDDIVYMYVAQPYGEIRFKTKVLEADIPYSYNKEIRIKKVMRLQFLKKYEDHFFDAIALEEYGIRYIRGPRRMPDDLLKRIEELYPED